jgi:hypothetical protein
MKNIRKYDDYIKESKATTIGSILLGLSSLFPTNARGDGYDDVIRMYSYYSLQRSINDINDTPRRINIDSTNNRDFIRKLELYRIDLYDMIDELRDEKIIKNDKKTTDILDAIKKLEKDYRDESNYKLYNYDVIRIIKYSMPLIKEYEKDISPPLLNLINRIEKGYTYEENSIRLLYDYNLISTEITKIKNDYETDSMKSQRITNKIFLYIILAIIIISTIVVYAKQKDPTDDWM